MRYIDTGQQVIPKHCLYGPRPAEGIVLSNAEWWSITDHLVKEQREKELIAVLREKEKSKKEFSYNMTKTWTNTLASIKTLEEQRRAEQMEREKQEKIDRCNEILKNRKQENMEFLEKMKKILYEDNDAIKTINSAVLLSTVLEGRKKQIEFKKSLEGIEAISGKEMLEKFKKEAESFAREKLEEKVKEKAKKRIQKMHLDKQMEEMKKRKQAEMDELEAEKEDLKNMKIEAEKVQNCNLIEQNYKKEFAAKYMRKTQNQLNFERLLVLEQEEEDAMNELYIKYDRRFKKERKEREEKMKKETIERRNKIAEQVAEKLQKEAKKQQELLDNAAEKKEEEERMEEERKENLRKQALADLLEGKRKAEEDQARREYEREEEKKWEMMQQYRSAEVNAEWWEQRRRRKKEIQAQTRAGYDKQCEEMREARERDMKEWLTSPVNESKEQENIRQYCQSTLEFLKKYNLPEYPVLVAIEKVKKENGITDEREEKTKDDENDGKKPRTKPVTGFCYCFRD